MSIFLYIECIHKCCSSPVTERPCATKQLTGWKLGVNDSMDRRKFVLGLGTASIGGATVLGTGAFSRVESHRGVSVEVAEDPDAYLGLDECATILGDNYVDVDEYGHIEIDIGENPNGGEGVNSDSLTWFDDLFEVCNQGKEDICLYVIQDENWPEDDDGNPRVDFYLSDDREDSILGIDNARLVEIGECTCIGLQTNTRGVDATDPELLLEDVDNSVSLVADVSTDLGNESVNSSSSIGTLQNDTGGSFEEVTDLEDPDLEPEDLAEALIAEGFDEGEVEIVDDSVEFTGADPAGGLFEGSPNIIGFEEGIILSSGRVDEVVGPNDSSGNTTDFGTPGDDDLEELVDASTFDAAVLEFEFNVPEDADEIFFNYVFGSDEYNQFVGSEFNDVFGFFFNGENVATVPDPDDPDGEIAAAINNINHGFGDFDSVNPELYVNNDPVNGDGVAEDPSDPPGPGVGWDPANEDEPYDTEMDGFTTVLQVQTDVNPAENPQELRLGVADVSDPTFDSWVLLEAGTLAVDDPSPPDPDPDPC